LQDDRLRQRDLLLQRLEDLLGRLDLALLCREVRQGVEQVGVARLLAVGGLGEGLLGDGELSGEFRAVIAFSAPGEEQRCREDHGYGEFAESKDEFPGHCFFVDVGIDLAGGGILVGEHFFDS
jgi:hypothetical protein